MIRTNGILWKSTHGYVSKFDLLTFRKARDIWKKGSKDLHFCNPMGLTIMIQTVEPHWNTSNGSGPTFQQVTKCKYSEIDKKWRAIGCAQVKSIAVHVILHQFVFFPLKKNWDPK